MRQIALIFSFLAAFAICAQAETVEVAPGVMVSKKTYAAPINEQPFFGFVEKSPAFKGIDDAVKVAVLEHAKTPDVAYDVTMKMAWAALLKQDYAEAAKRINQASLFGMKSSLYHGWAHVVFFRFKDPAYAIELMETALAQPQSMPWAKMDYARFLSFSGRNKDAASVLEAIVKETPTNGTAWALLGVTRMMIGDKDGACAALAEGSKQNDPHLNRETLAKAQGQARCQA